MEAESRAQASTLQRSRGPSRHDACILGRMQHRNRHIIIGTAGHVDHGKTELVRALTGVNTDRLKEEQARGISIELGFAELELPGGDRVGLVDVPGHERFVKAMLAGAAGMDLGLLVVAADESVMPQTREHLEILSLLAMKGGVVAITKSDLADDETLDLVAAEIEDLVRGTFLEGAACVRVSARTGNGLDDLRAALESATAALPPRPSDVHFRLPVDRVFTLSGVGLLVTGTAWSGRVQEGDTVVVLPAQRQARVRGVQVHGEKRQTAFAGERVAINLHGLKAEDVERGMLVASPGMLQPSFLLDVTLRLLRSWPKPLANRNRVRIHHGAAEVLGRVVLLDRDELRPGDAAPAQLRLESPLAADRGDLLVLRSYSPMRTLGGATVLDPAPEKHKRFRHEVLEAIALQERGGPQELVLDAVRRAGIAGITAAELRGARIVPDEELPALLDALVHDGSTLSRGACHYDARAIERAHTETCRLASEFQRANALAWGIGRAELQEKLGFQGTRARFGELLELLVSVGGSEPLHLRPEAVRAGSTDRELPERDRAALEKLAALLREAGATPPLPSELQAQTGIGPLFPAFVSLLEEQGKLVRVTESLLYDRGALEGIEAQLRQHLAKAPVMSMADFKNLTGLSRKFAIPLLEHFDRKGVTARDGDNRRPGPLLRTPA